MSFPKKTCNTCNEEKLLGFFHVDKSSKDGHRIVCNDCVTRQAAKKKLLAKRKLSYNYNRQDLDF